MKAIVRKRFGSPDVLELVELPRPEPKDDEVLLRVRGSSLNRGDRYVMQGFPLPMRILMGLFRPRKHGLGMDFAGDVAALGAGVTDLHVGDAVYGQVDLGEMWAEYACVPASLVAPKPTGLTYEQAGAVPASALTALQGLRDQGLVGAGHRVLVNGATGAVGTFAIQIAKALGAAEVTGVCGERNLDLVRSLGADRVIPYETEDFLACGQTFDVFFDVVGTRPLRACCKLLDRDGIFVAVGAPDRNRILGPLPRLLRTAFLAPFLPRKVRMFTGTPKREDLLALTEMLEAGTVTPSIDRTFALADTSEAMRHLIQGRPSAKVVLTV